MRSLLLRSIESNLFSYLMEFRSKDAVICNGIDEKWIYSGTPLFNNVVHANFRDQIDFRIHSIKDRFENWKVPVTWFVSSLSMPVNLSDYLIKHSFRFDAALSAMVLDLNDLSWMVESHLDLTVKEINDYKSLNIWTGLLSEGYEITKDKRDLFRTLFIDMGVSNCSPWNHFIAYLKNRPVATCTMYNHLGTIGIYWVSTVPSERRQGIASSLIMYLLKLIAVSGYRFVVIQANGQGKRCYEKIGFREIGLINTFKSVL